MKAIQSNQWLAEAERKIQQFAYRYSHVYTKSERQYSAVFEIGCFLTLLDAYKHKKFEIFAENTIGGTYKFLTTPSGNPDNFSFIKIKKNNTIFEVRQQVRVVSYKNENIYFTPDFLVLRSSTKISSKVDPLYANGRKKFFFTESPNVVAIHECKSLEPFPELFASFLGMLVLVHDENNIPILRDVSSDHLASSLFIGGRARGFHLNMIAAYEKEFPLNILTDIHSGFNIIKNKTYINS